MSILAARRAVNTAGQPSKVGGGIAQVLGWLAFALGLLLTLAVVAFISMFVQVGHAFWIGSPIVVLTLAVALPLLYAGHRLQRSGEARERAAQEHAIFMLAGQHGGVLTARQVARWLTLHEDHADALLTALAKVPQRGVDVEIDEVGGVAYVFRDLIPSHEAARTQEAVRMPRPPQEGRVPPAYAAATPRIIDAELIEEGDAPSGTARRAGR